MKSTISVWVPFSNLSTKWAENKLMFFFKFFGCLRWEKTIFWEVTCKYNQLIVINHLDEAKHLASTTSVKLIFGHTFYNQVS